MAAKPKKERGTMSKKIVLSIDGGVTGAGAIAWRDGTIEIFDLPIIKTDNFPGVAPYAFDAIVKSVIDRAGGSANVVAYVERSILLPVNGKQTIRATYDCRGVIRAVLALNNVSLIYVPPQTWKKFHGIPPKSDKEHSRGLALQLRPDLAGLLARKKDHNRAEAILLGLYGKEVAAK